MKAEERSVVKCESSETDDRIEELTREQLLLKVRAQQSLIESLLDKSKSASPCVVTDAEKRLVRYKQQRDVLAFKISTKDQLIEELGEQLKEMRSKSSMVDPAVEGAFGRLRTELDECKRSRQAALDDVEGRKFDPGSQIGRALVARCTKLLGENSELTDRLSDGTMARLESDLAIQKNLISKLKKQIKQQEALILDLDDEIELVTCACRSYAAKLTTATSQTTTDANPTKKVDVKKENVEEFDYDEIADVVTLSAPTIDDVLLSRPSSPANKATAAADRNPHGEGRCSSSSRRHQRNRSRDSREARKRRIINETSTAGTTKNSRRSSSSLEPVIRALQNQARRGDIEERHGRHQHQIQNRRRESSRRRRERSPPNPTSHPSPIRAPSTNRANERRRYDRKKSPSSTRPSNFSSRRNR